MRGRGESLMVKEEREWDEWRKGMSGIKEREGERERAGDDEREMVEE